MKTYFPFITIEEASYKELPSYDDRNYYFRTAKNVASNISQNEYVLKIVNHSESTSLTVLNGLSEMVKYLGSCGFNCPFPVTSNIGLDIIPISKAVYQSHIDLCPIDLHVFETRDYSLRLLTFIPGELLSSWADKKLLLFKFGQYLGSMDKHLQTFSHLGLENRQLIDWNLLYLLSLKDKAMLIFKTNESKQLKIKQILSQFKEHVIPITAHLRQSIIHNDPNSNNVVIQSDSISGEYAISGMIDFSDCVKAPTVFNLGIAMAHNMMETDHPATHIIPLLTGYSTSFPLFKEERTILYFIILGRLAQLCINGEYTLLQDPTNDYLQMLIRSTWKLFDQIFYMKKEECDNIWST